MALSDEKYVLLTTFKRDGTPVSSPVWSVPIEGGDFAFYTSSTSGKIKRLAHTQRVTVQPCSMRGKVDEGSVPSEATARVMTGGPKLDAIRSRVHEKYRFMSRVTPVLAKIAGTIKRKPEPYADRGVVITRSSDGSANPTV